MTPILKRNYTPAVVSMKATRTRPYPDLKAWRVAQGLSQQQAADFLGISQGYYCRLETRSQTARGKLAAAIMGKTGVPIEVLVGAA